MGITRATGCIYPVSCMYLGNYYVCMEADDLAFRKCIVFCVEYFIHSIYGIYLFAYLGTSGYLRFVGFPVGQSLAAGAGPDLKV
jgi:hypothetical protein